MAALRWGILGTGRIARQFAAALATARHGELEAVASRTAPDRLPADMGSARLHVGYDALLADPRVDAVYIATPHPMHAEWAIRAAEAGKHVLCEKPLGMNAAEADAMIDVARRHDVFLMEAYAYRTHPQTAALLDLVRGGEIGEIRAIEASFGFAAPFDTTTRQFAPALGGGGILDVGGYPVSMCRLVAGVARGEAFADPVAVAGAAHLGRTGVDEWASALLTFPGDLICQVSAAVSVRLANVVRVFGTRGWIEVAWPWSCSGKQGGRGMIALHTAEGGRREIVVETADWLYAIEADHVAQHVDARQSPAMGWDDTLGNMRTLDRWRAAVGLEYPVERPGGRALPLAGRTLARNSGAMPQGSLPGVAAPASRIVLGTMGYPRYADAAPVFDAFFEAGGNTFDTAFKYGSGRADTILGHWLQERGIRDQCVIVGKGAHAPDCTPEGVTAQLEQSLERLRTDHLDVYFLHQDNPAVPAGEFVDVLDAHVRAGRIRSYGGSNWRPERIDAANAYASRHGREGMRHVSDQFSLAEMVEPIWPGNVSAGDAASMAWLRRTGLTLFAWSAQARGFFGPYAAPDRREDKEMVRCWYSETNFARRARAQALAERRGTTLPAIALAYVLAQAFPNYAIIGTRGLAHLRSSLGALRTKLTPAEADWLREGGEAPL